MTVKKNVDGRVDCIPPWSIFELEDALETNIWIDHKGDVHTLHRKMSDENGKR